MKLLNRYQQKDMMVTCSQTMITNYKAIIFDGMAVANRINIKKSKLKSCSDYASAFVNIIKREARDFHEIRVVLWQIHQQLTESNYVEVNELTVYRCATKFLMKTIIGHLSTKQFLSDIETKNDLTSYLGQKLALAININFVAVFRNACITNIASLDDALKDHTHEEADTSIVHHALNITKKSLYWPGYMLFR